MQLFQKIWQRFDIRHETTRAFVITLAGHAVRLVLGAVSSAFLARGLGPGGLRVFSVVDSAVTIMATLADFGLRNSTVKWISEHLPAEPEKAEEAAHTFSQIRLLVGLGLAVLFWVTADIWTQALKLPLESGRTLVGIGALMVLVRVFSTNVATLLQAIRRFTVLMTTQTVNIVLTVVLMGGLYGTGRLTTESGLWVGIATVAVTGVLGGVFLPAGWRARTGILFPRLSLVLPTLRELWNFGKWVWLSTVLSILYFELDLLMVNQWVEPHLAGYYALALNLAMKAYILVQTLHLVLLPIVSTLKHEQIGAYLRRSGWQGAWMMSLLLGTIPLARPLIVWLYGVEYLPAAGIYLFLVVSVMVDFLATPLLLLPYPLNAPRLVALDNGLRVVVLLVGGWVLIPMWGVIGAAVAKLLAILVSVGIVGGQVWRLWRTSLMG